ncbi:zf-HC2 domain-containing protein [bacterium]|nr:zf-HC2 domain-containing protein [bacterium]
MKKQLTCEQVMALMTFYVENKLSDQLAKQVKEHLDSCEVCRENFRNFQELLGKFIEIEDSEKFINNKFDKDYNNKQYQIFRKNLSAYLDNELDINENLKIKKIAITNPLARRDLENMYNFKKLLHESFKKTENDLKFDFAKNIVFSLESDKTLNDNYSFLKLSFIYVFIIIIILAGSYYILHL